MPVRQPTEGRWAFRADSVVLGGGRRPHPEAPPIGRRRRAWLASAPVTGALVALIVVVAALPAGPRAVAGAQGGTPAAGAEGATGAVDLAAMALTAADLEDVGLPEFGIAGGRTYTIEEAAADAAEARGGADADIEPYRQALGDAGWRRSVQSTLAVPRADEPDFFAQSVSSYVDEYADAAGAAEAFAFFNDETAYTELEIRQIRGTRTFGEESLYVRFRGTADDTGERFQGLGLAFRLGNLEAGVLVYDWNDEAVAVGAIDALANRLLERVEAGLGEAGGLSTAALAIEGFSVGDGYANYLRRAGETFPSFGETPAEAEAAQPAAARDVFLTRQYVGAGSPDDAGDDAVYAVWLYRFPEEADAIAWLDVERDEAGVYAAPVAAFGEDGFAYSYAVGEGTAARRGYVGSTRVGAVGMTMEVGGPPEAPLAAFEELAGAQLACLEAGDCPENRPLPSSWTGTIAAVPTGDGAVGTPTP